MGAADWFALLHRRPFLGLRNLGLLNVGNMLLSLPLFAALYAAHRHMPNGRYALLASMVQYLGAAVYIRNNKSLQMLKLSRQYAAVASDDEKSRVAAAGERSLAQGEDFTPGAYPGFLLASLASLLMCLVTLTGGVFGKATGWAGIVGPGCLLIFTTWATFVWARLGPALLLAAAGGLASLAWYALLARGLLRLARQKRSEE
jgi:hypothetical protein